MGLESLPSVIFLLLPGFFSWGIFCWGTVTRKISQVQHLFISLLLSLVAFSIAYPFINLFKLLAINTFAPTWDIEIFPGYIQTLSNPDMISLELFIAMYILAVLLGFLLIRMYKNKSIAEFCSRVGLDLYGHEDIWYRLFHKADYVTVYLKDGNIVSGWPTYFSQSGDKQTSELYLTKIHYYQKDEERWVKPSRFTEGLLVNTDVISHVEFRRPEVVVGPEAAMEPEVVTEPETGIRQTFKSRCKKFLKWLAKYYIWAFGIMLAHLGVIGGVISFPGEALRLIILLYIFDAACIFLLCVDIYQKFQKGK